MPLSGGGERGKSKKGDASRPLHCDRRLRRQLTSFQYSSHFSGLSSAREARAKYKLHFQSPCCSSPQTRCLTLFAIKASTTAVPTRSGKLQRPEIRAKSTIDSTSAQRRNKTAPFLINNIFFFLENNFLEAEGRRRGGNDSFLHFPIFNLPLEIMDGFTSAAKHTSFLLLDFLSLLCLASAAPFAPRDPSATSQQLRGPS